MKSQSLVLVSAAIVQFEELFLVARKKSPKKVVSVEKSFETWEFPGGKCENQESLEECLHRELAEELDMNVKLLSQATEVETFSGDCAFKIHFFWARLMEGPKKMTDHDRLLWTSWNQLKELPLSGADRKAISILSSG